MPTTLIVIIVLILIVAIGCISFARGMSHNGGDNSDDGVDPDEILRLQEEAEARLSEGSSYGADAVTHFDMDEDNIQEMLESLPDFPDEYFTDDEPCGCHGGGCHHGEDCCHGDEGCHGHNHENCHSHGNCEKGGNCCHNHENDASLSDGLTAADISAMTDAEGVDIWEGTSYDEPEPGYDIFRGGNFFISGYSISEGKSEPMELAIGGDCVYMSSSLDGIKVGLLVDENQKVHMISTEKKAVLEVSESIMRTMGVSVDDMTSINANVVHDYPPLDEADSVRDAVLHGRKCTEYTFNRDGGECVRVFTEGDRFLRFATYAKYGILKAATDVVSITRDIPGGKLTPPEDCKKYSGITGFAKFMVLFNKP